MLSRFEFFLIRDRPFVFLVGRGGGGGGGGGRADFFKQLKLDFFIDKVKVFVCVIQLSTIAIRPYTLVKLQFHQISILKAIKNATGTSVNLPINISFIHFVFVLTSVPNIGERFTKT